MLRMGRGSKPEPTENERAAQQTPAYNHAPERAHAHQQPAETPRSVQQQAAPTTRAVTEAESLAREIKDGTMSGFVGGGTVLTGEVVFKGMLRVDGHLSGSVRSEKGTLIVSSGGRVDADVEVAVARVNGTVNGDITATERIEFGRTARVNGNISTPALAVDNGAVFEGVCHMKRPEPQRTAGRELVSAAEAAAIEVESRSNGESPANVEVGAAKAETNARDEDPADDHSGASLSARPGTPNASAATPNARRAPVAASARERVG